MPQIELHLITTQRRERYLGYLPAHMPARCLNAMRQARGVFGRRAANATIQTPPLVFLAWVEGVTDPIAHEGERNYDNDEHQARPQLLRPGSR